MTNEIFNLENIINKNDLLKEQYEKVYMAIAVGLKRGPWRLKCGKYLYDLMGASSSSGGPYKMIFDRPLSNVEVMEYLTVELDSSLEDYTINAVPHNFAVCLQRVGNRNYFELHT